MSIFNTFKGWLIAAVIAITVPLHAQPPLQPPKAPAQELDWAQKMFDKLSHDFGTVAERSEASTVFEITNLYQEDLEILKTEPTCNCMVPEINKRVRPTDKYEKVVLKTGQVAKLKVSVNTRDFTGERKPSLNVDLKFTKNNNVFSKAVKIDLHVFIRTDVILSPTGSVEFPSVEMGKGAEKSLTVEYRGQQANWQVTGVKVGGGNLTAECNAMPRAAFGGPITYQLNVKLAKNAPLGPITDQITLVTNDVVSPLIPVTVSGNVESDITILPGSTINLGDLVPGQEKRVPLIVRGHSAFVIEKIECESPRECFKSTPFQKEPGTAQAIQLAITPPSTPGPFTETLHLTIRGRSEPVSFKTIGNVVSPSGQANPGAQVPPKNPAEPVKANAPMPPANVGM